MYEFPAESWRFNTTETVINQSLWFLAGMSIVAWISRPKREPRRGDAAVLLIVGLTLHAALTGEYTDTPGWPVPYPFWVPLAWGMVLVATVLNWYRLSRSDNHERVWDSFAGILIFILLWACMIPAFSGAREAARRTQCRNNLKLIGLAFHNYHDVHEAFPPLLLGYPTYSWRLEMIPYLMSSPLYSEYDFEKKWNEGTNDRIAKTELKYYQCPSNPFLADERDYPTTAYVGLFGAETPLQPNKSRSMRSMSDGTSNTMLIVEACGLHIPWCEPRDVDLSETKLAINAPGKELGRSDGALSSYHQGGTQVVFADGAVRFLSEEIDPTVLKALTTATGGEAIDPQDF